MIPFPWSSAFWRFQPIHNSAGTTRFHQDGFATKRRHELPTIGAESSASTGVAFFGSVPHMNLCSKCYRDPQVSAEQAASEKVVPEKILSFKSSTPEAIAADIVDLLPSPHPMRLRRLRLMKGLRHRRQSDDLEPPNEVG
ncbi:Zinc finger A20 and AN1 domain-containing stress-associated protein 1 [Linum grandiflorum]